MAAAHIKCLTTPAAANKRLFVGRGQRFTHTMVIHVVKQIPEIAKRCPKDSGEDPVYLKLDYEESEQILQMKYRSPEETFLDTARRLLELEKKFRS